MQNVSAMPEKVVEVPLQEWLDALQKIQVSRHDMNRLIMNYLVTGTPPLPPSTYVAQRAYLTCCGIAPVLALYQLAKWWSG